MSPWALLLGVGLLLAQSDDEAALIKRLGSPMPAERREAAARLAEVGTGAAVKELARALRDTDEEVRDRAQTALWAIWQRSGNADIDRLLQRGIDLVGQGRFEDAVSMFDEVIARDPSFAEGWNKRATVYYLMGEYDRSLADCEEVIRRNPIHFGALSGFGLIYLQKRELERAAQYFERALAVNPNLERIEALLEELLKLLDQRRRNAI
jgi:tetratricopeptide (TPR) repeat protein